MNISEQRLHILRHSLGIDDAGNGRIYRNHYVCDPEPDIDALITLGLMVDRGVHEMYGGMHIYCVTDDGRKLVMDSRPALPKLTRSQKRYRDFLKTDLGWTFGEYLKNYDKAMKNAGF